MNIPQETAMRVGLAKIDIVFPYCHSLKEKRHLLHKIKDKVWSKFKVSIHEVSHHDKWQRAQLGLAIVGNDAKLINSLIDKIVEQIVDYQMGDVVDSVSEILKF